MILSFSSEQLDFRDEVVDLIESHFKGSGDEAIPSPMGSDLTGSYSKKIERWYGSIFEKGWALVGWPEQHGGISWDSTQKYIWFSECASRGLPTPFNLPGIAIVGPLLITLAQDDLLLENFLEGIKRNDVAWGVGAMDLPSSRNGLILSKDKEEFMLSGREVISSSAGGSDWALLIAGDEREDYVVLVELARLIVKINSHQTQLLTGDCCEIEFENERCDEEQIFLIPRGPARREFLNIVNENFAFYQSPLFLTKEIDRLRTINLRGWKDRTIDRGLAEIEIELRSLEVAEARVILGQDSGNDQRLSLAHLHLMSMDLMTRTLELEVDLLGYYSAPCEDRLLTHNEQSIGGDGVGYAIEKLMYINARSKGLVSSAGIKDRLARRLEITKKI